MAGQVFDGLNHKCKQTTVIKILKELHYFTTTDLVISSNLNNNYIENFFKPKCYFNYL